MVQVSVFTGLLVLEVMFDSEAHARGMNLLPQLHGLKER